MLEIKNFIPINFESGKGPELTEDFQEGNWILFQCVSYTGKVEYKAEYWNPESKIPLNATAYVLIRRK